MYRTTYLIMFFLTHCYVSICRYMLSLTAQDTTGQAWFSLFNDTAEKLLGYSADALYEMKRDGDENGYEQVFTNALFKTYVMKVRVKQESYENQLKVKNSVLRLDDVDFISESQQMYDAIMKYA
jgi:replication factor A1